MANKKEQTGKKVKFNDMVNIIATEKGKPMKEGKVYHIHKMQADKLIASGKATLKK